MRMQVRSLASLRGLGTQRCLELWCRSKTCLGSCVAVALAVAQASSCSSSLTPSLGISMCHGYSPKKAKKENKGKKREKENRLTVPKREKGGLHWEFGISIWTPLYTKWTNNKDLLCSTGNNIRYLVIA